jgi:Ca-activated chloride channel family protein
MAMNELERLKQAFDTERIAPRRQAKEAALAAALRAFDARRADALQGSGVITRLRTAAREAADILTGKKPMRMTHALAGGASLAVLTLAVLTTAHLQNAPLRLPEARPAEGNEILLDAADKLEEDADERERADTPPPMELTRPEATVETEAQLAADAAGAVNADEIASRAAGTLSVDQLAAQPAAPAVPSSSTSEGRDYAAAVAPSPEPMVTQEFAEIGSYVGGEIVQPGYHDQGRDQFEEIDTNPVHVVAEDPVSTFSIDVDTASYSFMRASLNNGVLPQDDAVRVEELINYFPYDYPGPASADAPFAASVSVMPTPWNPDTRLIHIGISGYEIETADQPRANLVFLIDTSGSMEEPNKLPLLINSMKLLLDSLQASDTVSIVTYAGSAGTVLEPTLARERDTIVAALDNLWAGGSTAGAEGIRQAYQLAEQNFVEGGVNRVILATDGDFNVGITDTNELQSFVEREREEGIFLSVLGFGRGNYNDALMQALAQNGNGAAAYIDTLNEARKVLVEEASSTMFPIAKDVKIQVEFNPATVSEYRLIGYETRLLNREDFNNDQVDAGEIGSGHEVTAIYEITPAGSPAELVDDLRYQTEVATAVGDTSGEYAFLRIRYKLPDSDESQLMETPIAADQVGPAAGEARFASAVAAFGQLLRGGQYTGGFGYADVIALAQANKGPDEFGYRAEFINLVRLAETAAPIERLQP